MIEEWEYISGYEKDYKVSNFGRIYSIKSGIYIKQSKDNRGYPIVNLCIHGLQRSRKVHRYVAETFLKNPKNKPQVNHIDGDKTNNTLGNLEWVTNKENMEHAVSNNLKALGSANGKTKFDEIKCLTIITYLNVGIKSSSISKMLDIPASTIRSIKNKYNWKTLSFLLD